MDAMVRSVDLPRLAESVGVSPLREKRVSRVQSFQSQLVIQIPGNRIGDRVWGGVLRLAESVDTMVRRVDLPRLAESVGVSTL